MSAPEDYRWVSCSKDADWATSQYRHLVVPGQLTTVCNASASHPEVWRVNSTKPNCSACMKAGKAIVEWQTKQLLKLTGPKETDMMDADKADDFAAKQAEASKEAVQTQSSAKTATLGAEHRPALEWLLEGAKRAAAIDEWAIKSLTEDRQQSLDEGFTYHAEKLERSIQRHESSKLRCEKEIAALTAALALIS